MCVPSAIITLFLQKLGERQTWAGYFELFTEKQPIPNQWWNAYVAAPIVIPCGLLGQSEWGRDQGLWGRCGDEDFVLWIHCLLLSGFPWNSEESWVQENPYGSGKADIIQNLYFSFLFCGTSNSFWVGGERDNVDQKNGNITVPDPNCISHSCFYLKKKSRSS